MGVIALAIGLFLLMFALGCAEQDTRPLWRCESHQQAQIFIDDVRHGVMRERTSCWKKEE